MSSRTCCCMELRAATKPTDANFVRVIRSKVQSIKVVANDSIATCRFLDNILEILYLFETSGTASWFEGKTQDNEMRLPCLHSCAQDSLHVSLHVSLIFQYYWRKFQSQIKSVKRQLSKSPSPRHQNPKRRPGFFPIRPPAPDHSKMIAEEKLTID